MLISLLAALQFENSVSRKKIRKLRIML